jgi:hypothetical protein
MIEFICLVIAGLLLYWVGRRDGIVATLKYLKDQGMINYDE